MKEVIRKINFVRSSAKIEAVRNLKSWCNFLSMPCGNCPFSVPPYDHEEGIFVEGVEDCALDELAFKGEDFKGYQLPEKEIDRLAERGAD